MELTIPVLEALAWRLVRPDLVLREEAMAQQVGPHDAWVFRRLTTGPHGYPTQLAAEALEHARRLVQRGRLPGEPDDLLSTLDRLAEATMRLEHGIPRIRSDGQAAWDRLCRIVDPDLMALALPAHGRLFPDDRKLPRHLAWAPVLRAQQTVFHTVCAGDLAEIHTHLGACLPNCLLWAMLMSGALAPEALWSSRLHVGDDPDAWSEALTEARDLLSKLATRNRDEAKTLPEALLLDLDMVRWPEDGPDAPPAWTDWPLAGHALENSAVDALLVPERLVVYRCLWCHRQGLLESASQEHLLEYIQIRNAFNVVLSQPPGHRGLNEFRSWYDRRSAFWAQPAARTASRRHQAMRVGALGMELAVETWLRDHRSTGLGQVAAARGPALDLELRTCIPLRGRAATDFFIQLAEGTCRVLRRQRFPDLRIGIIHHAIKARGREDGSQALAEFQTVWDLLLGVPEIRPLLVGLDAASDELACPPRTFSAAFRWVRDRLDTDAMPDEHGPIRLGFTFHAGEDFRDLLTGIRHVDEAAHLLSMRSGDRLGHALALSWPVDEFYIQRSNPFPTVGDHALDLWWACALLRHEEGHLELAVDAEERLIGLLTDCGARPPDGGLQLGSILDVDGPHKHGSPRARALHRLLGSSPGEGALESALREDELLRILGIPEQIWDAFAPRPGRPLAWRKLVRACQELVRRRVLHRGLIIEINPSSNRIVGGFSTIDRLPYPNINRPGPRAPGEPAHIPICLGTDDAGIFHTSLRREYELVGQAALARGFALPDVHAWLDEIRQAGRRACFIGPYAPAGRDLYRWLLKLLPKGQHP